MRILTERDESGRLLDEGRPLKDVTLYLTPTEARELASDLEQLADDPVGLHHTHLHDFDDDHNIVREITVTVYVDENINQFDARSRRLIETGE